MSSAQPPRQDDALDLLRHELKTPLTVVLGQAQLLRRRAARFDGMEERDRDWLLQCGAHIEAAVLLLVERIDGIGRE